MEVSGGITLSHTDLGGRVRESGPGGRWTARGGWVSRGTEEDGEAPTWIFTRECASRENCHTPCCSGECLFL